MRTHIAGLVALSILCARPAMADPQESFGNAVHLAPVALPMQACPTYTLTTTAATAIAAASSGRWRVSYQLQGAGYACVSWTTTSVTISANTSAATCTGNGAILVTANSAFNSQYPMTPTSALTAIEATGATLQLACEIQ